MENINLDEIALQILESVDYDIAKDDTEGSQELRSGIESILEDLLEDLQVRSITKIIKDIPKMSELDDVSDLIDWFENEHHEIQDIQLNIKNSEAVL